MWLKFVYFNNHFKIRKYQSGYLKEYQKIENANVYLLNASISKTISLTNKSKCNDVWEYLVDYSKIISFYYKECTIQPFIFISIIFCNYLYILILILIHLNIFFRWLTSAYVSLRLLDDKLFWFDTW